MRPSEITEAKELRQARRRSFGTPDGTELVRVASASGSERVGALSLNEMTQAAVGGSLVTPTGANLALSLSALARRHVYIDSWSLTTDSLVDDQAMIQRALTAAPGEVIHGVPGETYNISGQIYPQTGTILDLRGCTINLTYSASYLNGLIWVDDDTDIDIIGGTLTSTQSSLHGGVIVGKNAKRVRVLGTKFRQTAGFYMAAVLCRKAGVQDLTVQGIDARDTGWGLYVDGDETQTWLSQQLVDPVPPATTTVTLAGSLYGDIVAGKPYNVMAYYVDSNETHRLWLTDDFTRSGNVLTFLSALPTAADYIAISTWDETDAPANDINGVQFIDNVVRRCHGSPVQINIPIRAYHQRTYPDDCAKDIVISRNTLENPDIGDMINSFPTGAIQSQVISVNGVHNVVVSDNVIPAGIRQGIHLEDCTGQVAVTGNVVRNTGGWACFLTNVKGGIISQNTAYNFEEGGICIYHEDPAGPYQNDDFVINRTLDVTQNVLDAAENADADCGIEIRGSRELTGLNVDFNLVKGLAASGQSAFVVNGLPLGLRIGKGNVADGTYYGLYLKQTAHSIVDEGFRHINVPSGGKYCNSDEDNTHFGILIRKGVYARVPTITITASPAVQTARNLFSLGAAASGLLTATIVMGTDGASDYFRLGKVFKVDWDGTTLTQSTPGNYSASMEAALDMSSAVLRLTPENFEATSKIADIEAVFEGTIIHGVEPA